MYYPVFNPTINLEIIVGFNKVVRKWIFKIYLHFWFALLRRKKRKGVVEKGNTFSIFLLRSQLFLLNSLSVLLLLAP